MPRNKLPWYKRYPADWLSDSAVRSLSLASRGLWADLIEIMHSEGTDRVETTIPLLARQMGAEESEIEGCIEELRNTKTATVTLRHAEVTLISRRIRRELKKRSQSKLRAHRYREKRKSDGLVTDEKSEVRSQNPLPPVGGAGSGEPGKAAEKGPSPEDLDSVYASVLPGLSQPRRPLAAGVKSKLRSAIRREGWSLEEWREYFTSIHSMPFLMGKERDWSATLLWLVGRDNVAKVQGGNYLKSSKNGTPKVEAPRAMTAEEAQKRGLA